MEALEELRVEHERLLAVIRKRDRLLIQREAIVPLGGEALNIWDMNNWKSMAYIHMALTRFVRPIVFADYRRIIRAMSFSYNRGPGTALTAFYKRKTASSATSADRFDESVPMYFDPSFFPVVWRNQKLKLGCRVFRLRTQRGWSELQLAEHSTIPYNTIVSIEKGYESTTLEVLLCLARVFQIPLSRLVDLDY